MSSQDGTLEETLGQVEEIIRQMEESEVSLETSFQLYQHLYQALLIPLQEGVEKLKSCNMMVDEGEKKMLVLNQNGELSEF